MQNRPSRDPKRYSLLSAAIPSRSHLEQPPAGPKDAQVSFDAKADAMTWRVLPSPPVCQGTGTSALPKSLPNGEKKLRTNDSGLGLLAEL